MCRRRTNCAAVVVDRTFSQFPTSILRCIAQLVRRRTLDRRRRPELSRIDRQSKLPKRGRGRCASTAVRRVSTSMLIEDGQWGTGNKFGEVIPSEWLPRDSPVPPNGVVKVVIYSDYMWFASPPNDDLTRGDLYDVLKMRQTLTHKIGHGISISDWNRTQYPNRDLTVMITDWFAPTGDLNDPKWMSIPHHYDADDLEQVRIRFTNEPLIAWICSQ